MIKHSWIIILLGLMTGCEHSDDSINAFITQVENQSRKEIAQLAPERPFSASIFRAQNDRSPFVLPAVAMIANQPRLKQDCWQPGQRSKTGPLEKFPMDKLHLRGVMGSKGKVSGLVQTPEGTVLKLQEGEYIGLNNGKVAQVTSQYILIKETLPDGLGCWQQRNVKLALK
ncbi:MULTISPECIES: pilus assembly protein PilP [Vibrio]|uniref:Fimbrial protein n=1 Tax=Vibrio casei TaxID=673372 RepID=A0A368LKC2_9VIBR|nr:MULTISPECIES: pilus assembly protein PilP [Vibrio]RCS72349.1 fimbrial protein [Vibrio casei]SJN29584.1 Type IV pilus biogenesis protein PilP [Vibrio casei]HBV76125.1 fimbrial protein [Vibrio sp.]